MARRAARTQFVRPAAKTKMWVGANVGRTVLIASSDQLIGVSNAALLLLRPFTVLRTHQHLMYSSDQLAASEAPFGSYGITIVNQKATAIGITAVPAPGTEIDENWFAYQTMALNFDFGDATGFGANGLSIMLDSKSMRKVGPQDDIAMVTSQVAAVGAAFVVQGRMLIQLH